MQKAAGVFLETKHLHSFVVRCPLLPAACELREDCNLSARCRSLFYRKVLFEVAGEEGISVSYSCKDLDCWAQDWLMMDMEVIMSMLILM